MLNHSPCSVIVLWEYRPHYKEVANVYQASTYYWFCVMCKPRLKCSLVSLARFACPQYLSQCCTPHFLLSIPN